MNKEDTVKQMRIIVDYYDCLCKNYPHQKENSSVLDVEIEKLKAMLEE